jgi:hypothetical protein
MRFLLLLSLFLVASPFVSAQFGPDSLTEADLSIASSPEYPSPGEKVDLSLNDYGGSAYGASIEWFVNDTPIPGTTNQRNISLTIGTVGSKSTVKAVLRLPDGTTSTITRVFEPLYIDIIAEPQTHVPGFYKGRALPSTGSTVSLTALLNDGEPLGTEYMYLWRVNQNVLEKGGLRGGNRISFKMPQDSLTVVSLQVSKPDGTILGKRSVAIPVARPEIHFYEVNALYGIESRSLQNFTMIGNSATLIAAPYYLDSVTFNSPDVLQWAIDGDPTFGDGSNPYAITLEKTGYPGRATLDLQVQNTTFFLQGARNSIEINI